MILTINKVQKPGSFSSAPDKICQENSMSSIRIQEINMNAFEFIDYYYSSFNNFLGKYYLMIKVRNKQAVKR